MLKRLSLRGAVATGDAAFCRRALCEAVRDGGDDCSFAVKANRPGLLSDIEYTETVEKGHGRIEVRRLALSREVASHLQWPGAARVCRIERTRERAGKTGRAVSRAVTGLPRARAGPEDLLALVRRRRGIGNQLHYRRDVALREDASRIRAGNAPQALAALRNTMLRLVHSLPGSLAAIREAFAEDRPHAIAPQNTGFFELPCLYSSTGLKPAASYGTNSRTTNRSATGRTLTAMRAEGIFSQASSRRIATLRNGFTA